MKRLAVVAALLAVGCTEYEIELDATTLYRLNKRTGEVCLYSVRNRHPGPAHAMPSSPAPAGAYRNEGCIPGNRAAGPGSRCDCADYLRQGAGS